jgi:hypothetical protein
MAVAADPACRCRDFTHYGVCYHVAPSKVVHAAHRPGGPDAQVLLEEWKMRDQSASETHANRLEYTANFLSEIEKRAIQEYGIDSCTFSESVRKRLAYGAQEYGDTYLTDGRDLLAEALEECPDIPGYCILELLKNRENDTPNALLADHLFQASVYAALSDHYVRLAVKARYDGVQ